MPSRERAGDEPIACAIVTTPQHIPHPTRTAESRARVSFAWTGKFSSRHTMDENSNTSEPPVEAENPSERDQTLGVEEDNDEEQEETKTPGETNGPLIFISYRVHPDQHVAAALKNLLETSFLPTPRFFISGLGGLRPSSIGFKPQIQAAVNEAKAFVGIITPSSRDREWIFFEVGAAFGRQAIYMPLLVDVSTDDLPATIADYQACRAADREDMERSLSSLASQIGCEMRTHFSRRFGRFQKLLEDQKKATTGTTAVRDHFEKAMDAWLDGRTEDADAALQARELEVANDPEELTRVKIWRLQINSKLKPRDVLDAMDAFEPHLKATAVYAYWQGSLESRPSVAIAALRTAIARANNAASSVAVHQELLKRLSGAGHDQDAIALAFQKLREPNLRMRRMSAQFLCELPNGISPHAKFLIAIAGESAMPSASSRELALQAAESVGNELLRWWLSEKVDNERGTGRSANDLGRSLVTLRLYSLAFQAYMRAAEKGISVARVNAATLIHTQSVAAAAVAILDLHTGPFDAASPQYPYEVRARLEAAIGEEKQRTDKLRVQAERTFEMLAEFIERTFVEGSESHSLVSVRVDHKGAALNLYPPGGSSPTMTACSPLTGIYVFETGEEDTLFIGFDRNQAAVALSLDKDGTPTWLRATAADWKELLEFADMHAVKPASEQLAPASVGQNPEVQID